MPRFTGTVRTSCRSRTRSSSSWRCRPSSNARPILPVARRSTLPYLPLLSGMPSRAIRTVIVVPGCQDSGAPVVRLGAVGRTSTRRRAAADRSGRTPVSAPWPGPSQDPGGELGDHRHAHPVRLVVEEVEPGGDSGARSAHRGEGAGILPGNALDGRYGGNVTFVG